VAQNMPYTVSIPDTRKEKLKM